MVAALRHRVGVTASMRSGVEREVLDLKRHLSRRCEAVRSRRAYSAVPKGNGYSNIASCQLCVHSMGRTVVAEIPPTRCVQGV